jgi:hypothetical protein
VATIKTSSDHASRNLTLALEVATLFFGKSERLAASQCFDKQEGSLAVFLFVFDIA